MSFSVYLPKKIQPEPPKDPFIRAMNNAGEFLVRFGHKMVKVGMIALFRNKDGDLCKTKIEGLTTDGQYVYGTNGMFLAVREFKRTWRLQTPIM